MRGVQDGWKCKWVWWCQSVRFGETGFHLNGLYVVFTLAVYDREKTRRSESGRK